MLEEPSIYEFDTDLIGIDPISKNNRYEFIESMEETNKTPKISQIVQQALSTGYLTIKAENQLRQLLTTRYDLEDFNAFMVLQDAVMLGKVKPENRASYEDVFSTINQNSYKPIAHIQREKALLLFTKVTRLKETANKYLSINHPEKAKFYYYQIIDVLEILQEGLDINTRRSLMKSYLEIYQRIVAVSIYTQDFNSAFLYSEISRNRYLVERLSKQDTLLPITLPFKLYEKIKEAKINENKALIHYTYVLSNKQDKQLIDKTKDKWLEAKKNLDNLYSEVSESEPEFIAKTKVYPISFTEVQSLLQHDSAIIEFFFTEKVLVIMLILPGEEQPFICEDLCIELKDNCLEEIVRIWASNITTKTTSTKDIEIDENLEQLPIFLKIFSDYLLPRKLQGYIPPDINNLIIIPHKYLHLVPIHALWLNENQCLIERFSVSYCPSIQVWKICQKRQRQRELLLGIENPTQDKDLIFSKAEVVSISQRQQFLQTQILSGGQASKAEILRSVKHHHCFHFSGHAEYNFKNPLDSYLMLSAHSNDEDLTLNFILTDMQMPQADLVTLSACCTGVVDAFQPTDEYLGLPTGFLLAGAKAVVSSLWKVNSIATAYLLDEFYRQLDRTNNKAAALQTSQNWLRACSADELRERAVTWDLSKLEPKEQFRLKRALKRLEGIPFENPYYWAAFVLTGC
ncbi:CHAT domain-containing protein [Nostoc sp. 'Peltigera membranacea cyanobiont' N6]|uniref:CHAT domain-containing protein n=1 Tax=Nostoc sp. 'Peltigera membranacea cyanobiont' N6 TaxID=1261031 RepID=UPI003FA58A09